MASVSHAIFPSGGAKSGKPEGRENSKIQCGHCDASALAQGEDDKHDQVVLCARLCLTLLTKLAFTVYFTNGKLPWSFWAAGVSHAAEVCGVLNQCVSSEPHLTGNIDKLYRPHGPRSRGS